VGKFKPELQQGAATILERDPTITTDKLLTVRELQLLHQVWEEDVTQSALSHAKMQFASNLTYLFNRVPEIIKQHPKFEPTSSDIVNIRSCTTSVVEHIVPINKRQLYIYDVGGQRSQQKKWLHLFDQMTAVIFIVSLNEYDEFLPEEPTLNSMKESLNVWKKVINSPYFFNTPMILFMNKQVSQRAAALSSLYCDLSSILSLSLLPALLFPSPPFPSHIINTLFYTSLLTHPHF
jgi:hypothetical protein